MGYNDEYKKAAAAAAAVVVVVVAAVLSRLREPRIESCAVRCRTMGTSFTLYFSRL